MSTDRPTGVALVLVAGTLVLLAVLAVAFVAGTRLVSRVSGSAGPGAALAAESGLHYAASRLVDASYPRYPRTPENRGDDWSYREAATLPLTQAENPSYAHGSGGASGRLRGPKETVFSLRIESTGGKIPVNAFPGSATAPVVTIRGLVHALNNLGAIILPAGHSRRREITMSPGITLPYSWLGDDILSKRPSGTTGYPGWADLSAALRSLGGGAWYTPADIGHLVPFVTAAPPITTPQLGPSISYPVTFSWRPASPVELSTAPVEVLSALWRLTGASSDRAMMYWEPSSVTAIDPRTGHPFFSSSIPRFTFLFPDDANALTDAIVDLREASPTDALSWNFLRRHFIQNAPNLFAVAPPDPIARASYLYTKADLAFAVISPDPNPYPSASPEAWSSWGIDRPIGPAGTFFTPPLRDGLGMHRLRPNTTSYVPEASVPLGLTTRPPQRFEINCSAGDSRYDRRMSVSTALDTGTRTLSLTSQADFENPDSVGTALRAIGIRETRNDAVWSDPAYTGRRQKEMDSDLGWITHRLVSLPQCGPGYTPFPFNPATYPYYRQAGALALAPRQAGARGADLYWPMGEAVSPTERLHSGRPGISGLALDWGYSAMIPPEGDGPPVRTWFYLSGCDGNFPETFPFFLRQYSTPFFVTGTNAWPSSAPFLLDAPVMGVEFPGARAGEPVDYLAVEFWTREVPPPAHASADYIVRFSCTGTAQLNSLNFTLRAMEYADIPPLASAGQRGIRWTLSTNDFRDAQENNQSFDINLDQTHPAGEAAPHFVRIVVRSGLFLRPPDPSTTQTTLELHVDDLMSAQTHLDFTPNGAARTELSGRCLGDLRIYGSPRSEEGTARNRGRFVRSGKYISPLYVFERPVRVIGTQWTGITPAGWSPSQSIAVDATAYPDDIPTGGSPLDMPEASGTISTAPSDPIRSLRYQVDLSVPPSIPDAQALDTPVFEGIWFAFRPVGARVGWVDWTAR